MRKSKIRKCTLFCIVLIVFMIFLNSICSGESWIIYHGKRTDEFLSWLNIAGDNLADEVGGQADNAEHTDKFEASDDEECCAQWCGSVAWDLHGGRFLG